MTEIGEPTQPIGHRTRSIAKRILRHESAVLVLILMALMAGLGGMTRGATLTRSNISNIWLQSSSRGIASIGQTFVILTSGIDISVGGLALLVTIVGASLMTGRTEVPLGAIGIMLLVGLGVGVFNGTMVSRIGMPALIVTLGMWQVTKGLGYVICRGITFRYLPEGINFIGGGNVLGVPTPVIIFISAAVVAYFVLHHTTFGRSVYAVGGNPTSAWLSGIKVNNILFSVYAISGFLAGLAGLIIMSRIMSGGMGSAVTLELDSIAAVCI